jgi:hypothetical protein
MMNLDQIIRLAETIGKVKVHRNNEVGHTLSIQNEQYQIWADKYRFWKDQSWYYKITVWDIKNSNTIAIIDQDMMPYSMSLWEIFIEAIEIIQDEH